MSLFSTPATQAPAPFSFGGLGAPPPSSAVSSSGFALPTFSAPPPTSASLAIGSTAPATTGLGGLSQPPTESIGLGGTSSNVSGNNSTSTSVTKPKDTQIPPELMEVINSLKQNIHHNKRVCDEMSTTDVQFIQKIDGNIKVASNNLAKTQIDINNAASKCGELKESSRSELLHAEMVLRRQESLPMAMQYANPAQLRPTTYLESVCSNQEQQVMKLRSSLLSLEELLQANIQGTTVLTVKDLTLVMQRMNELIRSIAEKVHANHDRVLTVKEQFRVQRCHMLGQTAPDPFKETLNKDSVNPSLLRGPDPFSLQSRAAVLAEMSNQGTMATANPWAAQPPLQVTTASSLFGPPSGSLFSTPLTVNKPTATGLFGATPTSNSFRPFTSTTAATPVFPSFGTPTTTSNTSNMWGKLSSPFSSTSSGTLFGGSATYKPLGK